jgi:transcriptional regulator with XRE-family HTH domain
LVRVNQLLKEKGLTQKALADKLEKQPSEIHKWLNGDHNFTLRSIAKLQAELGETLIQVPQRIKTTSFIQGSSKPHHMTVLRNDHKISNQESINWEHANAS